ncbi:Uncharacterised protein [Serratia quinivorans]|uniref:hypothetical protein n=1 Tax=Serratia quinivorans TaxID=137545 RepID=UPI002177C527|nr:hypothetical protein [Serratia quinivorans]CAI0846310.1 Uncharacterised protein [Serratia quinivorans]CAI0890723.1 Uncharacterised protein [Serratia quinivorans]CAI1681479.1 Uncharacterised protein [Serratia quinivorans]CAI2080619.1 Uncharacterised protein [Serratia quinivorans]CAI2438565.1 Uncharacterised protein [Serratia quinivorans]
MASFKSEELKYKVEALNSYIEKNIKKNALEIDGEGVYLSRGIFPKDHSLNDLIEWGLYFAWCDFYRVYESESEYIDELTAFNLKHLQMRILPDVDSIDKKLTLALLLLLRVMTEIEFWEPMLVNNPGYLHSEYLTVLEDKSSAGDFAWVRDILPTHLVRYAISTTRFRDTVNLAKNIEIEKDKAKDEIAISLGRVTSAIEQDKNDFIKDVVKTVSAATNEAREEEVKLRKALNDINQSKSGIEEIRTSLMAYRSEYNFVGLYNGFKRLKDDKDKELRLITVFYNLAMFFAVALPLFTIVMRIKYPGFFMGKDWIEWLSFGAPFAAVEGLVLYYARLMYSEIKSIKTQLVQINLKGSLCQFIEAYMDYRNKIKNEDGVVIDTALDKFDSVIFSAIQMDSDNIPGAFDGVSAIAELAGKIIAKGK